MKKSVVAAIGMLLLVVGFCMFTVVYFPPSRDDMWSELASARYLVPFSILGLLAPLVNLLVRKENRLSEPVKVDCATHERECCCVGGYVRASHLETISTPLAVCSRQTRGSTMLVEWLLDGEQKEEW